jgi:hypothetical protein
LSTTVISELSQLLRLTKPSELQTLHQVL